MLRKYSRSPSIKLTVKSSRWRYCLAGGVGGLAFTAQYLLLGNVSVFVSTTLALLSIVVMRAAVVDSLIGSTLIWHEGEWFIAHGNKQTAVVLLAGSLRLPWIVYLGVRETHARRSWRFFLFSDSVNTEQLRRLRCRIVLTE